MSELAPCPPLQGLPLYGLVSLWDMINFELEPFYLAVNHIHLLQSGFTRANQNGNAPTSVVNTAIEVVQAAKPVFRSLDLEETVGQIDRLEAETSVASSLGRALDNRAFATYLDNISYALERETSKHSFYHYHPDKAAVVRLAEQDWATVICSFPSSRDDVLAATDCYALGHARASIYHCMMILERGLPAMAKRLKVPIKKDRATWAPIIGSIQKEIDGRRRNMANPQKGSKAPVGATAIREKRLLDAYELAAFEFKYFTNVWRNHIAHGREVYDENDAKKVLDHVKTFMDVLATNLNLKEVKI